MSNKLSHSGSSDWTSREKPGSITIYSISKKIQIWTHQYICQKLLKRFFEIFKNQKIHKFCDISTPSDLILPFLLFTEKSCFNEIAAKWYFKFWNFLIPIPKKSLDIYFIWAIEFLGAKDIIVGDPGLNFFVLLSKNMPNYKNKIQFAWPCSEFFSEILVPLCVRVVCEWPFILNFYWNHICPVSVRLFLFLRQTNKNS